MRTSAKVIRLCAVVPTGMAGSFVAIMALGFLPGAALVVAFFATVLTSIGLARGWAEGLVAPVLGFARGLRPEERAALEPTLRLAESVGLSPVRVLVRLSDGDGPPATPIGRDTVIVEPWLVQALHQERLGVADAATVIGHAVARQRVGPARFDLAARLWAFPWTLLLALIRRIAEAFAWVPAGGVAWHLRIVVGVVALVQGFQPGGEPPIGIGAAALVTVSYLAPAADRAWRAMVERDVDRIIARSALAEPLTRRVVQGRSGTAPPQHVRRIRPAACEASDAPDRSGRWNGSLATRARDRREDTRPSANQVEASRAARLAGRRQPELRPDRRRVAADCSDQRTPSSGREKNLLRPGDQRPRSAYSRTGTTPPLGRNR